MLDRFLPMVKDPADYLTALSLFKTGPALSTEEADKLLAVYAKYLPDSEDRDYMRLCLAADILPGRDIQERGAFAALALSEAELDALFLCRDLVVEDVELSDSYAGDIVRRTQDEALMLPLRVMLARIALDRMVASEAYASLRTQIAELAALLTECGAEAMEKYGPLIREVKLKCRR